MTKYKIVEEIPRRRDNIDYDTIYIKQKYGKYDKSADIVRYCKKDRSHWAILRSGKYLIFRHKFVTVPKESFIEILSSCYPEDYEFFVWHPEIFNGQFNDQS